MHALVSAGGTEERSAYCDDLVAVVEAAENLDVLDCAGVEGAADGDGALVELAGCVGNEDVGLVAFVEDGCGGQDDGIARALRGRGWWRTCRP